MLENNATMFDLLKKHNHKSLCNCFSMVILLSDDWDCGDGAETVSMRGQIIAAF